MGMEELGKPSPIAAQGPAAGNQSGLQGYIKSEYGGNWDPGWEREGAKTPPLPEPGDNPQPSGKEEGRWARLGAFSGGVAGAVTWLTATLLAAQYAVPLLDTTVAGLTPAAAVGRAIGMTFLLFGMFGTSIPAVLTGGKLGAGIGRWFDRKGGHKT